MDDSTNMIMFAEPFAGLVKVLDAREDLTERVVGPDSFNSVSTWLLDGLRVDIVRQRGCIEVRVLAARSDGSFDESKSIAPEYLMAVMGKADSIHAIEIGSDEFNAKVVEFLVNDLDEIIRLVTTTPYEELDGRITQVAYSEVRKRFEAKGLQLPPHFRDDH